jgi:bacteriocin biosynthesis cyclodehydratase domain-containing protein
MRGRGMSDMPRRPRVHPWYRVAEGSDWVAFEYAQTVVTFEGAGAKRFLPALLPLLDGTRDLDELGRELGDEARVALGEAVELLSRHRLVDDGPPPSDAAPPQLECAQFLAASHLAAGEDDALRRLGAARVVAVGARAEAVARLLRQSGVGEITRTRWNQPAADADLAVVAPSARELRELEAWNHAALGGVTPWLVLLPFDGAYAGVGPLFVPRETCCYQCYLMRRAGNLGYPEQFWQLERAPARFPSPPHLESLVGSLAAHVALRWLVARDPYLPGTFLALEQDPSLSVRAHHVYRVPRCSACSDASVSAPPLPWAEAA